MSDKNLCPECGAEISAAAPAGQCPQCMMKVGFESEGPASSRFEPPSVELLNELFPQLEVLELVGQGGMGAVYKARQPNLDRLVAVKVLPPEVGRDPAFIDRFTREARALARLTHPNIVALYEFGQSDGFFYFVMEYVDGANLRQALQAGKLQPAQALAIVPQICDALQFAHDEGIVHRDIKPENVLLDRKGRVKIADFGLAKLLGAEQIEITLTHTNQVMGTLRYMAPEQLQDTHDVDHRADIYSLGVVFYELLTGDVPMGRFDPPSRKVQIDVRLDEVVLRALAQEPDKRYQHASEVKTDLELLAGKPVPPVAASSVRSQLRVPATGLLVAGIVNLLAAASIVLIPVLARSGHLGSAESMDKAETLFFVVIALVSLGLGIILLIGSARMFDLQAYGISLLAALVAILPVSFGFPISLPFGIWALYVLSRQDVKSTFADWNAESERERVMKEPASAVGVMMAVGLALGAALGAAMDNLPVYMTLGMVLGILVGWSIEVNNRRKSKD